MIEHVQWLRTHVRRDRHLGGGTLAACFAGFGCGGRRSLASSERMGAKSRCCYVQLATMVLTFKIEERSWAEPSFRCPFLRISCLLALECTSTYAAASDLPFSFFFLLFLSFSLEGK